MNIVLIHQHCPFLPARGGVETFLQDFLNFVPDTVNLKLITSSHSHPNLKSEEPPCTSSKNTFFPDTFLTIVQLIRSSRGISFRPIGIVVNRFEYVIAAKILHPRSSVDFFKHTIGDSNESKSSDSTWRYFPRSYRLLQKIAYRLSTRVWTFDEMEFAKNRVSNWQLLKASTDLELFKSNSHKPIDIAWIGRLESPKNPKLASDILVELKVLGFGTRLIGNGRLNSQIESYLLNNGEYISSLERHELARLLGDTKILLMTSIFEAAPRVMLEALSSGCLILCTPSSDPNHLIEEYPTRIYYFRTKEDAVAKTQELVSSERSQIDLSSYSNKVQFSSIWSKIGVN